MQVKDGSLQSIGVSRVVDHIVRPGEALGSGNLGSQDALDLRLPKTAAGAHATDLCQLWQVHHQDSVRQVCLAGLE